MKITVMNGKEHHSNQLFFLLVQSKLKMLEGSQNVLPQLRLKTSSSNNNNLFLKYNKIKERND